MSVEMGKKEVFFVKTGSKVHTFDTEPYAQSFYEKCMKQEIENEITAKIKKFLEDAGLVKGTILENWENYLWESVFSTEDHGYNQGVYFSDYRTKAKDIFDKPLIYMIEFDREPKPVDKQENEAECLPILGMPKLEGELERELDYCGQYVDTGEHTINFGVFEGDSLVKFLADQLLMMEGYNNSIFTLCDTQITIKIHIIASSAPFEFLSKTTYEFHSDEFVQQVMEYISSKL